MRQAIWFLIASLLGLLAVNAQAADRQGHVQSIRFHVDYTVQADGRFTKEVDEIVRVHTQDCLLYTSPSPRDRTRSRMPSSA